MKTLRSRRFFETAANSMATEQGQVDGHTLPETNIAPTNGWLEYYFPIGEAYFQGRTVSFREGNQQKDADRSCFACFRPSST